MGSVYLAGPITGLSYEGCTDWREYVRGLLPSSITVWSPLRSKQYLLREKVVADQYDDYVLSRAKGITVRDRWDAQRADVLLANLLDAERVSIGTVLECAWADAARRPIVLVMEPGNVHEHAMLNEIAGFVTPSLVEAVFVVKALLLAGVPC